MDFYSYVNSLKSLINLKDLLSSLGVQVNRHNMINCIAPDHEDKHPSCWVGERAYGCYSCGSHGDCFDVLRIKKGLSFKEALDYCADYAGIQRFEYHRQSEEEIKTFQEQKQRKQLLSKILAVTVQIYEQNESNYLIERGISPDIIKSLHIGATNGDKTFLKKELLKRGFKQEQFAPLLLG